MTGAGSDELNHRTRLAESRSILELALASARRPCLSSRFGPYSAVFLHLVTRHVPDVPVIRVDTGYDTRATRAFVDELRERLSLDLHIVRPRDHTLRVPPAIDDPEHAAFVETVKLEPFRRALAALDCDVWLSSVRRYQSVHRASLEPFEPLSHGRLKVSPMLGWSEATLERYAREHGLPRGPDVFDPTKGEPFRECGLHTALGA